MSYILYYSNMCEPSRMVLRQLKTRTDIHFICIDKRMTENGKTYILLESGQKIILPETVERVPALLLMTDNYRVLYGSGILQFFDSKNEIQPPPIRRQPYIHSTEIAPGGIYERQNMSTGGPPPSSQYPNYAPSSSSSSSSPSSSSGPGPGFGMEPDSFSFSSFSSNTGFSDSFSFIGLHPEQNTMQQMRGFVGINEGMGLSQESSMFDSFQQNTEQQKFFPQGSSQMTYGHQPFPPAGPQMSLPPSSSSSSPQTMMFQQQQQQQQQLIPSMDVTRQSRIPEGITSEYLTNLRQSELQSFSRP